MSSPAGAWLRHVVYSEFAPGNEERIDHFFRECGYQRASSYWQWALRGSPYGPAACAYAELDGRIISHYAVIPTVLDVGGTHVLGGLGIALASHPDFRSAQVVVKVVKQVEEICRRRGIRIIYGFPNEKSWLLLQRLLGWRAMDDLEALEAPAERLSALHQGDRGAVTPTRFTQDHAALLDSTSAPSFTRVHKSPTHLDWRYGRHPERTYYLIERREENRLTDFLVAKLYDRAGQRYGHIVDLGGSPDGIRSLVSHMASIFSEKAAQIVSLWIQPGHPLHSSMIALGFEPSGFVTHFGYKRTDEGQPSVPDVPWLLGMGDSDVF